MLTALLGCYVLQEIVTMAYVYENMENERLYEAMIFFYDLADSAFLAVLLLVSTLLLEANLIYVVLSKLTIVMSHLSLILIIYRSPQVGASRAPT